MRTLLSIGALAAGVAAQQTAYHVVPAAYATNDAPDLRWVAGFSTTFRQQTIVDPGHLQPMRNKWVVGLWFRRDANDGRALAGGLANLKVQLSTSPNGSLSASQVLADNVGQDAVVVFNGQAVVPDSPATSAGSVPWDGSNAVHLQFTPAFLYQGGSLCIDVTGSPDPARPVSWWPADAAHDSTSGAATSVGSACGPYSSAGSSTSFVSPATLVVGGTAEFFQFGSPGALAGMLIGLQARPNLLNLQVIGAASGCYLHVAQIVGSMQTSVSPLIVPIVPSMGGRAHALMPIPNSPVLLSGRFATQWVELGPAITASNALDCTIASRAPTLGMAIVSAHPYPNSPIPATGIVDVTSAHVLRFEYL